MSSKFISTLAAFAYTVLGFVAAEEEMPSYQWQDGDIIFSCSENGQGEAIITATGSPITHCGVFFFKDGKQMVIEAVQPVSVVSLAQFISRSTAGPIIARRPRTSITTDGLRKAKAWAEAQIGKPYDIRFLWGDDMLYCSELVWKFYQIAGIELCPLRNFHDYDLEKPAVTKIIKQRFGGMVEVPLDEKVVAPSDLAGSVYLVGVPVNP